MANFVYPKAKEHLLAPGVPDLYNYAFDLMAENVRVSLVRGYTPNLTTDERYSSIESYVVATSADMTGKSVALGVFTADDIVIPNSEVSASCEALVIHTRRESLLAYDPLVAYIDTGTLLPITPDGTDITVTWDDSGIFSL